MSSHVLPIRGFLLHLSHYDPVWVKVKSIEKPFDFDLAVEILETMAASGFNLVSFDCEDALEYASHPELKRNYTVPMKQLESLARRADELGLEVMPKLNFSAGTETHNYWFRPYDSPGVRDTDEYFRRAFLILDEIIAATKPKRFFHIGMDEDFARSHRQYVHAINVLHDGFKQRGLRVAVWNDSATMGGPYETFGEKCQYAEQHISKGIVQIPWCYRAAQPQTIQRLVRAGFEVWGAPGGNAEQALAWKNDLQEFGGSGVFFTRWIPCRKKNRRDILTMLKAVGPVASSARQ